MSAIDRVIQDFPSMSQGQLKKVMAAAQYLLNEANPSGSWNSSTAMVYRLVDQVVSDSIGSASLPLGIFLRSRSVSKSKVNAVSAGLITFIKNNFGCSNRAEMCKAITILARAVVNRLRRDGVPISHQTVFANLSRVPTIVDSQFPGYRQSGMLKMLLSAPQRV